MRFFPSSLHACAILRSIFNVIGLDITRQFRLLLGQDEPKLRHQKKNPSGLLVFGAGWMLFFSHNSQHYPQKFFPLVKWQKWDDGIMEQSREPQRPAPAAAASSRRRREDSSSVHRGGRDQPIPDSPTLGCLESGGYQTESTDPETTSFESADVNMSANHPSGKLSQCAIYLDRI